MQSVFATMIFNEDFESGSVNNPPNSNKWGRCSGNCTVITTEYTRSGKKALKTYLNRKTSDVSYRTEAVPRGEVRENTQQGQHYWYGISVLIPNNHSPDSRAGDTILQWHHSPDQHLGETNGGIGGPPLSLQIHNTKLVVVNRWNPNAIGSKHDPELGTKHWDLGSYQRGKWIDWVFHIKWSYKGDGILEVWKDGKKVISKAGPNNYNDQKAPYMKIGLYKTDWRKKNAAGISYDADIVSRTFYHDELRIAKGSNAKYNDVAPSGNASVSTSANDTLKPPTNIRITNN